MKSGLNRYLSDNHLFSLLLELGDYIFEDFFELHRLVISLQIEMGVK